MQTCAVEPTSPTSVTYRYNIDIFTIIFSVCDINRCVSNFFVFKFKVIKLLGTEKGKKNKTNLIFLAGKRVLKYAEKSYNTERSLVSLLK